MKRFEKQVIQKKAEVECRIAEPGNFAIQHDEASGCDHQVLRTVVGMDESQFCRAKTHGFRMDQPGNLRVLLRRGEQIWRDSEIVKMPVRGEDLRGFWIGPAFAMDCAQRLSGLGGCAGLDLSGQQHRLPVPELVPEKFHREEVVSRKENRRHGPGQKPSDIFQIVLLMAVAGDVGEPFRLHAEFRQGALHGKLSPLLFDAPDIARDAARERGHGMLAVPQQARFAQSALDFNGERHQRGRAIVCSRR